MVGGDGTELWLDRPRLQKLWLVGQQKGQTSPSSNQEAMIGLMWPALERSRWEVFQGKEAVRKAEDTEAMQIGASIGGIAFSQHTYTPRIPKVGVTETENSGHIGKRKQRRLNREKPAAQGLNPSSLRHDSPSTKRSAAHLPIIPMQRKRGSIQNESNLQRQYGLNIHRPGHGVEGRRLVRGTNEDDSENAKRRVQEDGATYPTWP